MRIITSLSIIFISGNMFAANLSSSEDLTLQFVTSGVTEELPKGKNYSYNGQDSIFVTSPGRVPLLIVPVEQAQSQIKISLIETEDHNAYRNSSELKQLISTEINAYTIELFQLQKLISQGKKAEARVELYRLEQKYPGVSAIHFIAASLAILDGQRGEARARLERGLKLTPNYDDGIKLLKSLNESRGADK